MQRIAIIGGGAAGAAVVGEFLRRGTDLELFWFIGDKAPGRGVAYATSNGQHLLNVRAANMGLFADDVGEFFRYLHDHNLPAQPGHFVPRKWFGDYVEAKVAALVEQRAPSVRINTLATQVTQLQPLAHGIYRLDAADGASFEADGVVLAIGALPPVPIAQVSAESLDGGRYLPDPWKAPQLEHAPQRVVVLGSGLTAVDVILSAAAQWPDAQIIALSRHGCFPAVHRAEPSAPYADQMHLADQLRTRTCVREWTRLLRQACREDCVDWRAVIDGLRPITIELWRSLSIHERRRFLRHARWAWEAVRHRMPPQTAEAVELLRDEGRLAVIAGRIRRVEGRLPLVLMYRRRDDGALETFNADLAIQATGLQTAVRRTTHPLLARAFGDGWVCADPQGLGVNADPNGRILRADGTAAPGIRAIGTLLRGALWECSALPEIRMMAARLARELVEELRTAGVQRAVSFPGEQCARRF